MEKRMTVAMACLASIIGSARDEDEPPTIFLRRQPESYRDDNYSGRRNARNTGKSYAITADPARAKVKAARKQSMKNRKKK